MACGGEVVVWRENASTNCGFSDEPNDSTIVRAIIDMSKNLKQRVIAEGIETQEQFALLQSWRCAEGRGYLFSRPVPAAQFAQLLQ